MERLNLTRLKDGTLEGLKKLAKDANCTYHNSGKPNVAEYAHRVLEAKAAQGKK